MGKPSPKVWYRRLREIMTGERNLIMKICPRYHQTTLHNVPAMNALSRRDNKTFICEDCGKEEAYIDSGIQKAGNAERNFIASLREAEESSKG